jgi:hypothetical protein
MKAEIVTPSVDLLDSMRSVGYSLEAAVADIVDNSLAAQAHLIDVDADVVHGDYIAFLDDGKGMSPETAREALRLAGSTGERSNSDLGRFGLGLKTASLSQARSLTVVSRQGGKTTGLRWDIDHVRKSGSWSLLVLGRASMKSLPLWNEFDSRPHGTLVVWNNLDLLLGDAVDGAAFLAARLNGLRANLGLVFHRFLRRGTEGLAIRINGLAIQPIDPFLSANSKTQISPKEAIPIGGASVEVIAYTLPHPSGLTPEERRREDLGEGMRDAQGFYVYRNRRLISHGHWYGLARASELAKQTRIQVDVPTSLDTLWQLDIKKSRAEPPASFKSHLRRIIDPILASGRRVHTYRGRRESPTDTSHIWNKIKDRDGFRYEVNLDNPTIQAAISLMPSTDAERMLTLFQTLAESYPILDLYQELAGSTPLASAEHSQESVLARLRDIRDSEVLGKDIDFVTAALSAAEPFNSLSELGELVEQVWREPDAD